MLSSVTVHVICDYPISISPSRLLDTLRNRYLMRTLVHKGVIVDIHGYTILRTHISSTTNTFNATISMDTTCCLPKVGDRISITPDIVTTMKRTSTGDIYNIYGVLIFVKKGATTTHTICLEHVAIKSIKTHDASTLSGCTAFQYRCVGVYI
jgi:transcriptional regulatory protein LevR